MIHTFLILGLPGGMEFIVIILLVLLFFGGRKIPELARGIGKGIREFNSARANVEEEIKQGMLEEEKKGKEANKIEKLKSEQSDAS